MELVTKELEKKFESHPLYSTEEQSEKEVIAKYFLAGTNWTWYVFEAEKQDDGDWLFFGLVQGIEDEYGYFTLNQLKEVRNAYGLGVERDLYFEGTIDVNEYSKIL